jgi:hypothetical protein
MPGLSRHLVEHHLPIKHGFRLQPIINYNPILLGGIKDDVDRLLKAEFIRL